jgi:hypothetical protein
MPKSRRMRQRRNRSRKGGWPDWMTPSYFNGSTQNPPAQPPAQNPPAQPPAQNSLLSLLPNWVSNKSAPNQPTPANQLAPNQPTPANQLAPNQPTPANQLAPNQPPPVATGGRRRRQTRRQSRLRKRR